VRQRVSFCVEKNSSPRIRKRETRVNVYKFSGRVHLSDHDENFRSVGFDFNIDLRVKN
jgi:hypothetical protein